MHDHNLTPETDMQILHPGSRKLFAHWEKLRAERAYPAREEFTFAPVNDLMPDMILIEKDQERNSYRFRLAGTRVCALFGGNLTSSDVLTGWDAFDANALAAQFELALTEFQPILVRMRLVTDTGLSLAVEMIAMPIQARDSSRIQLIGGLFSFREIRHSAHHSIQARELVSTRAIWTEHQDGARLQIIRQALPLERLPRRPKLTVVEGGKSSS